ncbi:MAG: hypothetical protein ACR2QS_11695 [Woeseiaceae bacterium]
MKNAIIWGLVLAGIAYGGSKFYMHHKVEEALDSAVMMMSPYAEITYDGVSSTMMGKLTVDGLRANIEGFDDEVYVEHLGIDTPSYFALRDLMDVGSGGMMSGSDFPDYIGFVIEGVHIPSNADYYRDIYNLGIEALGSPADASEPGAQCVGKYGHSPAALRDLGYNEQVLSFAMYLRMSESTELMNITASVDEMWSFEIDLSLVPDVQNAMTPVAMARRKLSKMNVVMTDHSLNARISEYCEKLGLSPEQTMQARLDALHFIGENNGIIFDEYFIEPYKEFVSGKDTLVVTAQPTNPINITQIDLYKPSDVPALLNLAAIAK